jgi:hypothetical protein
VDSTQSDSPYVPNLDLMDFDFSILDGLDAGPDAQLGIEF